MLKPHLMVAMIVLASAQLARAADDPSVLAGVECEFMGNHTFPFSAGRDRCWEPVNGKTLVPKTVLACAVQRSDATLSVTFVFSESAKPECDNGKVASKEQYTRALPLLGAKERAFFVSHVDAK